MKREGPVAVAVLGSTGSIGVSTLDVVDRLSGRFRVVGLAAGGNLDRLTEQIEKFRPGLVSVRDRGSARALETRCRRRGVRVAWGPEGAEEVAASAAEGVVVSAITGIAGLGPTLAAVRSGARVALANKESLVTAGGFLRREARRSGAEIIPVDSEHSGVFQCLAGLRRRQVRTVVLTASGGPFFRTPLRALREKTVAEALRHPRWRMGPKVTVDSATLMNKGLELIEARWLFELPPSRLDVLIHPQSVVHALVETADGAMIAQLSATDMRLPIQYALTYPERLDTGLPRLDLERVRSLEFHPVDARRYPLFGEARLALEAGGSRPVALNAANEEAVAAFLAGGIRFTGIADAVRRVLEAHADGPVGSVADVLDADLRTRAETRAILESRF